MKLLFEARSSISTLNKIGFTTLYEAARTGHTQAARMLIERGRQLSDTAFLFPISSVAVSNGPRVARCVSQPWITVFGAKYGYVLNELRGESILDGFYSI